MKNKVLSDARMNVLDLPDVCGDGVHDDTAGLQAALDSGAGIIHLPTPPSHYLISRTLVMHSGQALLADRNAVIRLADHAHAHMLTNADHGTLSRGITVRGGIWDGNNTHQTCEYHETRNCLVPYNPARYLGVLLQFNNVEDLHISGLTLKNPETFGIQMGNIRRFTVEDITFDYNKLRDCMDGVHLHGNCHQGRIANLKGDTNDDMVALNADDGWMYEMSRGSITDIQVDGLWCDRGYTAVRLLSEGSPIRRVRISNVFGTFSRYVTDMGPYNVHPGEPSEISDIVFDGIFCAKTPNLDPALLEYARTLPLFRITPKTLIRNLHINNLIRTETVANVAPCVVVCEGARVEHLGISQASVVNLAASPLDFLHNQGSIESLNLANIHCRAVGGAPRGMLVRNDGNIAFQQFSNITVHNLAGPTGDGSLRADGQAGRL
ncbi:MAG: glycoside hydrolase family 55 protein [Verrucomicrobia bacterium]|nr:glycoside hydrolase family 55 protein [Verrucomicrobiota bacterium]MBU1734344.1 glycoside hydrolase family 55 protein [Verrucomicrobiota bacterium]MBU1857976.1 glycoside hydrolase family 55 protein [Verrucomicrobiota bacterium]